MDAVHRLRWMPSIDYDGCRPSITMGAVHPFRAMPTTGSGYTASSSCGKPELMDDFIGIRTDPSFLTTEETAQLLNVHQNTIVRWIESSRPPPPRSGVNIVSPERRLIIELTAQPREGTTTYTPAQPDPYNIQKDQRTPCQPHRLVLYYTKEHWF